MRRCTRQNGPDPVDVHVGARVRARRDQMKLSQTGLAAVLDISFQQIQKYERGANRMGASRLFLCAQALNVPVSFFFDGLAARASDIQPTPTLDPDPAAKREALEFTRAYHAIEDDATRQTFFKLAKAMARAGKNNETPDLVRLPGAKLVPVTEPEVGGPLSFNRSPKILAQNDGQNRRAVKLRLSAPLDQDQVPPIDPANPLDDRDLKPQGKPDAQARG